MSPEDGAAPSGDTAGGNIGRGIENNGAGIPADVNTGNEGGGAAEGPWYASLPEEFHENPNVTKYGSLEELARGHVNMAQMIGRDKIPMPKTDDEYMDVYRKLGAPDTPGEYQFALDENITFDETYYPAEAQEFDTNWYKAMAQGLGLNNKQAGDLYNAFMSKQMDHQNFLAEQKAKAFEEAQMGLRKEWGQQYEGNLRIATRMITKLFGEGMDEALLASGISRNQQFMKGLANLGNEFLEELGIDKTGNSTATPNQLKAELAELQGKPAYFDKTHPEHKNTVAMVWELQQRITGEK